jgi:hypothetical protein
MSVYARAFIKLLRAWRTTQCNYSRQAAERQLRLRACCIIAGEYGPHV